MTALLRRHWPRIAIVDIDDPSLQQMGQWPWSRDKSALLTTELIERQQAAVLGFDVLFTESDRGEGADAAFARALDGHRVALGYYFTQTAAPRAYGSLPAPVLPPAAFPDGHDHATRRNGFGASISTLARAAPRRPPAFSITWSMPTTTACCAPRG